jgi:hypothetical protein
VTSEDPKAELLRRFQAAIGGAELDDLRQLTGDLLLFGGAAAREAARPQRPELRRQPLLTRQLFRVRVDLVGAKPPIWRRLDIRSDLTLDAVHRVLQAAFDWMDSHLWRFALGGNPFDQDSQVFLCEWDADNREVDDDDGINAHEVRLDETIQEAGDVLGYVYDYGDHWELRIRLESVSPAPENAPHAVAVDGRRAAPPEDCGGIRDAESLAEVIEDPAAFDLDVVNEQLRSPFMVLSENGFDQRLMQLVYALEYSPVGKDLNRRAHALVDDPGGPDDAELLDAFSAFRWFLSRADRGGIPLTAAGYLKPADVEVAAKVVPSVGDWIGKLNREADAVPVLHFRKALQSLGLLRKQRDSLLLTRAGAAALEVPGLLWNHLADRLVPAGPGFETDATLLMLAYAATSAGEELPLEDVAAALNDLDWRTGAGRVVERHDLYWLRVTDVLTNVTVEPVDRLERWRISPAAARLARAALKPR